MKRKTKETNKIAMQKGITLIALVVTIVVLLILAGVSINLVLGDKGIISKAKEAGNTYTQKAEEEKVELDQLGELIEDTVKSNGPTIREVPEGWIPLYTPEDLAAVAKGETKTIKEKVYAMAADANYIVMQNIDLKGINWTPIEGFKGNFDGNNCLIKNLTSYDKTVQGLFGTSANDIQGVKEIKNISLSNVDMKNGSVGCIINGVMGTSDKNTINITNCHVQGKISGGRTYGWNSYAD